MLLSPEKIQTNTVGRTAAVITTVMPAPDKPRGTKRMLQGTTKWGVPKLFVLD